MKYRFLPFQRYDPYFKTGLNRALIESVADGNDPAVFLAGWDRKCVNIGYGQKVEEQVDTGELESREDIVLVRRQGGGGTTFLTPEGEITWGIVAPESEYPEDPNKIYEKVCGKVAEALGELGIEARHEPINDVVSENGKLSGSTVKKKDGVVYIGGTLLYRADPEEMFSVLDPPEDKKKDKQIEDYQNRVSSVSEESDASFEQARKTLKKKLLEGKDFRETSISAGEKKRAEDLANKYRTEEWIYRK